MRQTMQLWRWVTISASLLMYLTGTSLMADQTATFNLNGVGGGGALDGVYTSPYQADITIGTVTSSKVAVICDDFADNSYNPETWTANVTNLSEINAGTIDPSQLKWNDADSHGSIATTSSLGWDLDQKLAYNVAAYLAIRIMETSAHGATTDSQNYSYALWELFDANTLSSGDFNPIGGPIPTDTVVNWLTVKYHDAGTLSAATTDVENAIAAVTANPNVLDGWDVNIYTFKTCGPGDAGKCKASDTPQEFITATHVPESSSLVNLGAYGLFGVISLVFFGRRRMFKASV